MRIDDVGEFLRYYGRVRQRTRAVIDRVPPEDLEWSPRDGVFSAGDLTRHLAGTERWMFVENALGRPSRYPGHGRDLADGYGAVVAYLDALHEESMALLADLTPSDLAGKSPTPAGIELRTWKWLRAMVEHEVHHRGQLYSLLGLRGVSAPPLYGLTEPQVLAASQPPSPS